MVVRRAVCHSFYSRAPYTDCKFNLRLFNLRAMDENSDVLTIQRWSLHNVSIIRTDLHWFVIFVLREPTWTGLGKTYHTMGRSNVDQPLPNEMLGPLTVAVVPRHLDNAPQHRWPRRKLSSARCSGDCFCC